jgi:predicted peptidase
MRAKGTLTIGLGLAALTLTYAMPLFAQRGGGGTMGGGQRGGSVGTAGSRRGGAPIPGARRGGPFSSATASRIQTRSYVFPETNEPMPYAVFVSTKVDTTKTSPLIIALHGLGVPPTAWLARITDAAEAGGYVVAAPTGYNLQGWYGANGPDGGPGGTPNLGELSEKDVMNVLALMRKEFLIDDQRIYLLGQSMGGAGALYLGIKHRDIWAAVGASAPAIRMNLHAPDELEPARHIPMILVHGDEDPLVPVANTRLWADRMKALHMTYEYRELHGVGHNAIQDGARFVFEFFKKHVKPAPR